MRPAERLAWVPGQSALVHRPAESHDQARRRLHAHAADPRHEVEGDDGAPTQRRISQWLVQLKERVGWRKAVVALANENACILWAVLTLDGPFNANHVPCHRRHIAQ